MTRGGRVLDFGAGSWLRYSQRVAKLMPGSELVVVEYAEAFRDDAATVRDMVARDAEVWRPIDLVRDLKRSFDLILLVNVLNTLPEEAHRQSIFDTLAARLNPKGWLLIYQRIWAKSENPQGAVAYGDGWFVPQGPDEFTYRAATGHKWFSARAAASDLRPKPAPPLSSANTLIRLWENPF